MSNDDRKKLTNTTSDSINLGNTTIGGSATSENGVVEVVSISAETQQQIGNFSATQRVVVGSNDSAVILGVSERHLINADNINNTKNQDAVRKEELTKSQEHMNLMFKQGYSKESGSYTEGSLLLRDNKNNFFNTTYSTSSTGHNLNVEADLLKTRATYSNSKFRENSSETLNNIFNLMYKGGKNQYKSSVTLRDTTNKKQETEEVTKTKTVNIGAEGIFNRNEHGEFNEGLNGVIAPSLTFKDGKYEGYEVKLDGAYNIYNKGNSGTDFLGRGVADFGKNNEGSFANFNLQTDYRINNCNTIFEQGVGFSSQKNEGTRKNVMYANAGVYQQVGKNFGDATVFAKTEIGRALGHNKGNSMLGVYFGGNVKATSKLSFDAQGNWKKSQGWQGNVTARITL